MDFSEWMDFMIYSTHVLVIFIGTTHHPNDIFVLCVENST